MVASGGTGPEFIGGGCTKRGYHSPVLISLVLSREVFSRRRLPLGGAILAGSALGDGVAPRVAKVMEAMGAIAMHNHVYPSGTVLDEDARTVSQFNSFHHGEVRADPKASSLSGSMLR